MEKMQAAGLQRALAYLDSDPWENIPKIINWMIKLDREEKYVANQARVVRDAMSDKDNNWYRLVESMYTDIDDGVRKRLFENFLINASFLGRKRQDKVRDKHGCNIPWAILLDPTSACNLHCIGCWASEYGNKLNLSFEEMDSIVTQGKEIGVFFYIFSGGEPLVRKDDIIRLCEKHPNCAFLSFTNGTLIDEKFADEMLRVKNFVPAISVEGFEAETDARRGAGTYQAVTRAMEILKAKKLPFGISCCYTSQNVETIGSEEYFDDMIEKGAKFAWLFTYMPVGNDAVPELLVSAEQRKFMYNQVRSFRQTKPIFTMDFWNDGEYAGGCVAGGRRYLHINANGDVEPCAFIHYSNCNIRDTSLLDALKSPLFMQYHDNQPFNDNHLRPCPLLDNHGRLAEMVERSKAYSTDLQDPENVHELTTKCKDAAEDWAPVADRLWNSRT
ncbi:MAG: radical SAM protein [Firmicutes bacterium]|nr:radical SAM protein [Bacillota bacterium]